MPDQTQHEVVADLTGGQNGVDPPMLVQPNQVVLAQNVEYWRTRFARKRNGISASSVTFSAGGPFTGFLCTLLRHVPGTNEGAAEMWGFDSAPVVGRKAGATTWTAPTLKDALSGSVSVAEGASSDGGPDMVQGASLNGLFFLSFRSAVNRLHVWDSVNSIVRRTGFATPAAPTVANTGAGTYAAVLRYYRVRWTEQQSGTTVRRSEPGASTSFTPSGTGTAARVTQPAVASETETHWEVEGSTDNVTFYRLTTVAIATTTYDDSAAPSSYASNTISAATGTYVTQKSYRHIAADQNRLLGFGSYTSTDRQNRVEFSAVVGSLNVSDAERVPTTTTSYVDLDENDSGLPTGLVGPLYGNFYAFKVSQLWELRPTGDVNRPYQISAISKTVGAVASKAYTIGEDAKGRPCLYFMSLRGMYRYGAMGLEYIGRGIENNVLGPTATLYLGALNRVCHMVYHKAKSQLWVWFATGSSNNPNRLFLYHTKYDAWTQYVAGTGTPAVIDQARCSVMHSSTFGATFSRDLLPYIGDSVTTNQIFQCDDSTVTADAGTAFQSVVNLRWMNPWGPGYQGRVGDCRLLADNQAGVTITVRVLPNGENDTTRYTSGTALLTVTGTEAQASRRVENTSLDNGEWVQYRIGEFSATSAAWTIHMLTFPWVRAESNLG